MALHTPKAFKNRMKACVEPTARRTRLLHDVEQKLDVCPGGMVADCLQRTSVRLTVHLSPRMILAHAVVGRSFILKMNNI